MTYIIQGGIFMIPLLTCSVMAVAIIIERLMVYHKLIKTPLILQEYPEKIVKELRRYLAPLHTIITISPMLGLLGTVSGLMRSFYLLGNKNGLYQPQEISLGISEALITTEVGLVIAVTATVFYNYFTAQLDGLVVDYNSALTKGDTEE